MVFIFHLFVTLFCQEFGGTPAALHWLADLAADVALTVNFFFYFYFLPTLMQINTQHDSMVV